MSRTYEKKALTVGELRLLLAGFPDDMPVMTEGCDCSGWAGGVEVCEKDWDHVNGKYQKVAPFQAVEILRDDCRRGR
jgi:hypothetical protein